MKKILVGYKKVYKIKAQDFLLIATAVYKNS
jgi:hypothetical protein